MSVYVGKKFCLSKKIGSGSFGEIYLGVNVETNEEVAIKLEDQKTLYPQLNIENRVYQATAATNCAGIAKVKYFGREGDYTILVMELLGSSLEQLFDQCGRKFTLKTVLMLADKMLHRVEGLHACDYIHRDIKPDNFLMGRGINERQLYLIDFGLSKKFCDGSLINPTRRHIPFRNGKSLTGTARYASLNAHEGSEQSRRDDLESLGYLFIYFLKGSLPWQNMRARTKQQKYARICEKKLSTPVGELCDGLPGQFITYLMYCRNLPFEKAPDYHYLRTLFRMLFLNEYIAYDGIFDWTPQPKQRKNYKVLCMANDSSSKVLKVDGTSGAVILPPLNNNTFSLPPVSSNATASRYPFRRRTPPHFILPPTRAAIEDLNRLSQVLPRTDSPFQMGYSPVENNLLFH